MLYQFKVRFLKNRYGAALARRWLARRGHPTRSVQEYIKRYAPGRSFIDIGGMWGIDGEHSFLAEAAGATRVLCVDEYKTPEFDQKRAGRGSAVEFLGGDASDPSLLKQVGMFDVVWCFGVLYHHPSPYQLLAGLRQICGGYLILESLTIPDIPGLQNASIFYPMQSQQGRKLWDTRRSGGASAQHGIATDFRPELGYANNFWGLSPSAIRAVLATLGFEVEEWGLSPNGALRHVFCCRLKREDA